MQPMVYTILMKYFLIREWNGNLDEIKNSNDDNFIELYINWLKSFNTIYNNAT